MKKNNFVVDYQVTGKCNMKCDFCAGASKKCIDQDTSTIMSGIEKLSKVGVDTIVFTGGEPLLRPDIVELIKYTKQLGIHTYLSTNGLLLPKYYSSISDYLDCLGIPLDGSNAVINGAMSRSKALFESTSGLLKYFIKNPPKHILKVGTIVSKVNFYDLLNIGVHLFENPISYTPDTWRLYQFTPILDGFASQEKHYISDQDFKKAMFKIKERFPEKNIKPLSNSDSDNSYIFIDPLGEIRVLKNDLFVSLGNINKMNLDELTTLGLDEKIVIDKGSSNRSWLNEK